MPIPKSHHFPLYQDEFTKAPNPLPDILYKKQTQLALYDHQLAFSTTDKTWPSQFVLQEAKVCEVLTKQPHPNVAMYHGCVVEGGRIVGLAFTKYNLTLCQRWKTLSPLNKEKTLMISAICTAWDMYTTILISGT